MHIQIIAAGKIRDPFIAQGIDEYTKRLRPYTRLVITEVPEEKVPKGASKGEEDRVRRREGEGLTGALPKSPGIVIALDPEGVEWSSEEFAGHIRDWEVAGTSRVIFLIGGPLGLSDPVREHADSILSLSRMTFTHPMARLILIEQIYRAFRIARGEPYHK